MRIHTALDLASYIRPKVHRDASTNVCDRDSLKILEIELVHPQYGVRILAYSHEHLDDRSLQDLKQEIHDLNIAYRLGQDGYQPILITNVGEQPYSP